MKSHVPSTVARDTRGRYGCLGSTSLAQGPHRRHPHGQVVIWMQQQACVDGDGAPLCAHLSDGAMNGVRFWAIQFARSNFG